MFIEIMENNIELSKDESELLERFKVAINISQQKEKQINLVLSEKQANNLRAILSKNNNMIFELTNNYNKIHSKRKTFDNMFNELTDIELSQLQQGTKIEFKYFGSPNLFTGFIEVNKFGELYFCAEHNYDANGQLTEVGKTMQFYNRFGNGCYSHFKILSQPKQNNSFVVSALRWGNDEDHSYVVGVFDDEKIAIDCANKHKIYRGDKYECIVEKFKTNHYEEETSMEDNEIIYKTYN